MVKVTTIMDNKRGEHKALVAEHGLSFLVETEKSKILFDFGAGKAAYDNACKLNIGMENINYAIGSHGHYDHAGGYPEFSPDACLINRYCPGAKLSLHQDKDEQDLRAPIVSVSLGLPAIFQFGGLQRSDPLQRLLLEHGDVVVWGGESRLFYHGIQPLKAGHHPETGDCRYNLTFRQAGSRQY